MFSTTKFYNSELNETIITYYWFDEKQMRHKADSCTKMIEQIEQYAKTLAKNIGRSFVI